MVPVAVAEDLIDASVARPRENMIHVLPKNGASQRFSSCIEVTDEDNSISRNSMFGNDPQHVEGVSCTSAIGPLTLAISRCDWQWSVMIHHKHTCVVCFVLKPSPQDSHG